MLKTTKIKKRTKHPPLTKETPKGSETGAKPDELGYIYILVTEIVECCCGVGCGRGRIRSPRDRRIGRGENKKKGAGDVFFWTSLCKWS